MSTTCPRAAGSLRITVVDVDPTWRDLGAAVVSPAEVGAATLGIFESSRALLNLAAPGALVALATLRAAHCTKRVWAFLGAPGARCVLMLGPVETASRPFAAGVLAAGFCRWVPRNARIVMASGAGPEFLALRHALVREGRSVSLAWDTRQATDVLSLVRADLVVVDLDLPPAGGHRFVAQLAHVDPPPAMVLVPGRGDDAAGHLAALMSPAHGRWLRLREDILTEVVPTHETSSPPPRVSGSLGELPVVRWPPDRPRSPGTARA